ncbi:hypothetical protein O181_007121 [Austropuccinia psidii MF-1]|uniref:J domain-containing protein n=1 Tax=Austropuccinia psidii MF-1 TaxID=1389203 RepID=A0A9Q3BM68_9BASI|nr:hypothetical protein [Austropuccinia psidii MF-1]
MADSKTEIDYYSVVGVTPTADSNEITSAYRKASLKVHPDRNPDDPQAAEKFHALKAAFELLQDPVKRSAFDAKRAAQAARVARFAGLDSKRKALARDLEAREEAYLKQQNESTQKAAKAQKLDEIKAAGLRMRQAKEAELLAQSVASQSPQSVPKSSVQPVFDSHANMMSSTLRLKWLSKKFPNIETSDDLTAHLLSSKIITSQDIESIVMSSSKKPSNSEANALVVPKKRSALIGQILQLAALIPLLEQRDLRFV